MADDPQGLLEHLTELRKRLIISAAAIAVCACAVYRFVPQVLKSLTGPVGRLVFINPTEAFWVNLKLAFFLGLYLALPVVFYQIWLFLAKGLRSGEKRSVLPFVLVSFLLFNAGALFCYFFIVPLGIKFLLSYAMGILTPMITVNSYLSLLTVMVLSFGIIFQMPLLSWFLTAAGLVTPQALAYYRRYAVVGVFVLAAVLTPPDIFTQISLAIPLVVLYEAGILISRQAYKKRFQP